MEQPPHLFPHFLQSLPFDCSYPLLPPSRHSHLYVSMSTELVIRQFMHLKVISPCNLHHWLAI